MKESKLWKPEILPNRRKPADVENVKRPVSLPAKLLAAS